VHVGPAASSKATAPCEHAAAATRKCRDVSAGRTGVDLARGEIKVGQLKTVKSWQINLRSREKEIPQNLEPTQRGSGGDQRTAVTVSPIDVCGIE
jgi:hypothetical protein